MTKHDDSLFMKGGKLKTGLNCPHNFNNDKRHYIKSGVEKDVLHLVEDLDRVMVKYVWDDHRCYCKLCFQLNLALKWILGL